MPYHGIDKKDTKKMDDCVQSVMKQGHDKSSAIAICYTSIKGSIPSPAEVELMARNFDKNVGGGTDRDKMPVEDFAGKNRSFPIKEPGDVSDAASSIGRAGPDNYDSATLKRNIIRIAKRKGKAFVDALPEAWKTNKAEASFEWTHPTQNDVAYVNMLLGAEIGEPELLKFENALLCKVGRNLNGDYISAENLAELESTLSLMAIDDEHKQRMINGFIVNPHNVGDMGYIDGLIYARRFPENAAGIVAGTKKLSVEAYADEAQCSECKQVFGSEADYCEHLKNRRVTGASRLFAHLKGVGAAITDKPAEPEAGFDGNHITFLASIEPQPVSVEAVDTIDDSDPDEEMPMADDTSSQMQSQMEGDMEELDELKATLADVQAKLAAAEGERDTFQAQLQAKDVAYKRGLELISTGFTQAEIEPMLASLATTDEAVYTMLKASRTNQPKEPVAEPDAKPQPKPQPVMGGDQGVLDLSSYSDLFA